MVNTKHYQCKIITNEIPQQYNNQYKTKGRRITGIKATNSVNIPIHSNRPINKLIPDSAKNFNLIKTITITIINI